MASERSGPDSELPDFRLPRAGGGAQALSPTVAGATAAVVVFWSSVCSHCRRYDAYLNGFQERYPKVPLLVVAARQGETLEGLRRTVEERALRFPLLHDGTLSVARQWAVRQTPRAFLLGPDRRCLYRGAIDNFTYREDPTHQAYLEQAVEAVLAGRPVPRAQTPGFGCPVASVYYDRQSPFDRSGGAR